MKLSPRVWNWNEALPGPGWLDVSFHEPERRAPTRHVSKGSPASRGGARRSDALVVWLAWVTEDAAVLARLCGLLSADERARLERLRMRADQHRFLIGRGLLRILVGAQMNVPAADVQFSQGSFGKPLLVTHGGVAPLQFNVSHSGKIVLLAFHRVHPVGVDVEEIRPGRDLEAVAQRMFSPEECSRLARLDADQRQAAFFQAWTCHEARLKALGLGLSDDPNADADARLETYELALPAGYQGAVAVQKE